MIYEILQEGAENATTGKEICEKLDISIKEMQTGIRRERKEGRPICASTGSGGKAGYFIPINQGEMRRYCNSLTHRAGEIYATRKACLDLMDTLPADDED
jgi:biotin operon repressor